MKHDEFIAKQKQIIENYEVGFITRRELHHQLIQLNLEAIDTNDLYLNK